MEWMFNHQKEVNGMLARYGVKFGIYKNNTFMEQLFPFDVIPRTISYEEFDVLERGLIQRVTALNLFLADIYGGKKIVSDGIIPEDFVFSSSGFSPSTVCSDTVSGRREIFLTIREKKGAIPVS